MSYGRDLPVPRRRLIPVIATMLLVPWIAAREETMSFSLSSPAFVPDGPIPKKYTCDGNDVSPPLMWRDAPPGTESLALILEDPDAPDPAAPRMTWVHWVLYDLPPATSSLPEDTASRGLPEGSHEGLNDWKRTGYGGPCPPVGRHRYIHRLYALDVTLGDLDEPTRQALEAAMAGHVLAEAELMGTYQRVD